MYLSYCFDLLVRWLDKITKIVPKRCVHQPWPIKAKHHKINFAIVKFQMPNKKIFISIFCLPLSFIYFSNHPGSPNTKLCLLVVGWIIPKTILCLVLELPGIMEILGTLGHLMKLQGIHRVCPRFNGRIDSVGIPKPLPLQHWKPPGVQSLPWWVFVSWPKIDQTGQCFFLGGEGVMTTKNI